MKTKPDGRNGWWSLAVGALLAILPKCIACVATYLAVGAGVAGIGREWCGEAECGGGVGWLYGGMALTLAAALAARALGRRRRCARRSGG